MREIEKMPVEDDGVVGGESGGAACKVKDNSKGFDFNDARSCVERFCSWLSTDVLGR